MVRSTSRARSGPTRPKRRPPSKRRGTGLRSRTLLLSPSRSRRGPATPSRRPRPRRPRSQPRRAGRARRTHQLGADRRPGRLRKRLAGEGFGATSSFLRLREGTEVTGDAADRRPRVRRQVRGDRSPPLAGQDRHHRPDLGPRRSESAERGRRWNGSKRPVERSKRHSTSRSTRSAWTRTRQSSRSWRSPEGVCGAGVRRASVLACGRSRVRSRGRTGGGGGGAVTAAAGGGGAPVRSGRRRPAEIDQGPVAAGRAAEAADEGADERVQARRRRKR